MVTISNLKGRLNCIQYDILLKFYASMIVIQKIIRGLTTRIENQFKTMNESYRYSTQSNPCFSNIIFSGLPSLVSSSDLIDDILMASAIDINTNDEILKDSKPGTEKLVFEHFLDYTVSCLNPIFYDFYSNDNSDNGVKKEEVSFFELVRLNFYSSILSILTAQNNIKYLKFTESMYSAFLQKFTDFFTDNVTLSLDICEYGKNNYLYLHCYSSVQNIFNSLSRFNIDIFKDYINENDSKGRGINLSKICDAALLLVQNEQSLQSFTKDLPMMLGISTTDVQKTEFLNKLFHFFTKLSIENTELYQKVIQSENEIIENIHVFFILILQLLHVDPNSPELILSDSSFGEISKMLPILCLFLPFLHSNPNFDKYKNFVFVNFRIISEKIKNPILNNPKEMIFDYLNSFIALFQSTLLITDSEKVVPSIATFVNSLKSDFDTFLFKFESSSQSLTNDDNGSPSTNSIISALTANDSHFELTKSSLFLFNVLPRYLALDIAKASKDYDSSDTKLYSITQSVSFCTQSSNIYCSLSLVHGLLLLIKGYPFKGFNPIAVQIILNIIFNLVDVYKTPSNSPSSQNSIASSASPSSMNASKEAMPSSSGQASNSPANAATSNSNPSSSSAAVANRSNSLSNLIPEIINVNYYSITTIDILHRDIYELISGHSFYGSGSYSNEYYLIPTFLDLIASENSTSLAFYHFMLNEIRTNFMTESKSKKETQINVSDFSPDTIASFFVLMNAVFIKPSRWTIFSNEGTNTNRFFMYVNLALYKLYKDLLRKNVTALFFFDSLMMKYLNFAREIIKISKMKVSVDLFIDSYERVLLLMDATSGKLNSELLNNELHKFANEFNVPFIYQWPLKINTARSNSMINSKAKPIQTPAPNVNANDGVNSSLYSKTRSVYRPSAAKNDQGQVSLEKLKKVKETVILPTMKFVYLHWFESSFHYLCQNNFINFTPNTGTNGGGGDNDNYFVNCRLKSTVSFQLIIHITSFLCRYSFYIDEIQPLLQKRPFFKSPKIKFANAYLDFISHDIKDDVTKLISSSIPLFDSHTSNMLLKIIRSNIVSSSSSFSFSSSFISLLPSGTIKPAVSDCMALVLHPNCYIIVSELLKEESVFYNDQSYKMCEEIILNLVTIINMDEKFKMNTNDDSVLLSIKTVLYSISDIIYKFYSFHRKDVKSSNVARMSIISTILNYMISTQNKLFLTIIAKPLPQLFKDFVITAEDELSGTISDYENLVFIRKTIDKFFSFFVLILSSNDKSTLLTVCQESLENILESNYKEAVDIFITSLLNYSKSDFFSTVILKSFISISKKLPEIIQNYFSYINSNPAYSKLKTTFSKLNVFRCDIDNSSFTSIINSNINSIHFYEAVIDVCSYQNKLRQLFMTMCNKYKVTADVNDSNYYERIISPFFFISFFKIAATQPFINKISFYLFKMNVEKTTENLAPPIQFVYYWQLFVKLTKEDPFVVLDKFFIRPILLQPHLYKLDPTSTVKMSNGTTNLIIQYNAFIKKLSQHSALKDYLDHLKNDRIEYFEVYPNDTTQYLNSQSVIFHFLANVSYPGNFITFSNVQFDKNCFDSSDSSKFGLARIVFEFIESQCLVCIDKDRNKNKNWLLNLDKIPENSIPIIHECFRVLVTKTIEEQNNKKNVFGSFYEETNSNNTNNQKQLNSNEISNQSNSNNNNNNSNKNDDENVVLKSSKKKFSKSIFKIKQHSKKSKDDDKNKTKTNDNENSQSQPQQSQQQQQQNEENISYLNQINLYVNMRVLPNNYLNILETVFNEKVNSINLIFTPIGILHEIESNIINKQPNNNFNNLKVISDADKEEEIILPFHVSSSKVNFNCMVNNRPGSIGFFQEYIVISTYEYFRGQQYQVETVTAYTIFRLPKTISKTAIEIYFQGDQIASQSSAITVIQGKKADNIVLDFDLNENKNENKKVVKVTPEFIIEAIQSSTGSTIGNKKINGLPLNINSDPTIALIALSLFYISNNDSTVSETSLELFWLIIKLLSKPEERVKKGSNELLIQLNSNEATNNKSAMIQNLLNPPLDGFIRTLQNIKYNNGCQEATLFSSVVQFVSPFLSIARQENTPMLSFLSLIYCFISTSSDRSVLAGVCHSLLLQFNQKVTPKSTIENGSNETTLNDQFQLLQIWSTVKSESFTRIALPQILVFVQHSMNQSQLIHCLSANNRKTVNEILIENILYKDLTSFRLHRSICTNGLFKIFPSVQFIGRPEIILFLSLVVAMTGEDEIAQSFITSLKSFVLYYQRNKQLIQHQSNEYNDDSSDDIINDDDSNTNVDRDNSIECLFTSDRFNPDKSNIFASAKQIINFFDKVLQDSVSRLFELLTKKKNSNVWYLKPSLSTSELLDAMTDSIVPELNLKKLNFCLATFKSHTKDIFHLFWVALPYLLFENPYIRRLAIDYIAFVFKYCGERNDEMEGKSKLIDPFEEFLKVLNSDSNMQFSIRAFGEAIGVKFEENLPIAFASILIGIILRDDTMLPFVGKLIFMICKPYKREPHKILEFVLILMVYSNKVTVSFIRKFPTVVLSNQQATNRHAIADFVKATVPSKSKYDMLWIMNFLVWFYSQPFSEGKYQLLTLVIFEISKARSDITKIIKNDLITKFMRFTDNKDTSIQEYLAFIFAIANSASKDGDVQLSINQPTNDNNNSQQKAGGIDQLERLLWTPKTHALVEKHLISFCVNIHAAIQKIVKSND